MAGRGEACPVGRGIGPGCGAPEDQACLLPELPDRACSERAGAGHGHAVLKERRAAGGQGGGERHGGVGRIDRASGEDEFRRHEGRPRAPLAHQDAGPRARVADEDHGRGVADGVRHGAEAAPPKPCMRLAHWKATIAPLKRGRR